MENKKIGFIGLGTMGFAMCYGLFKKGFTMVLPTYRRQIDQSCSFTPLAPDEAAKTALYDEMLNNGCEGAGGPAELFAKSDFIMISMPTSRQVEMNMYGPDGIIENARPGTVVIDLTSADANSTRKLYAELEKKGIDLLDAPISGGQAGAANQTLTVMAGGKEEVFEKARPILETIGQKEKVTYVGPSGAGDTIKCANNFLSMVCLLASTEALAVAGKAGIDPRIAAKVIASGGGSSHATLAKYPNTVFPGKPFSMSVDLMLKDIGLYNALAKEAKVPAFFGETTYQIFGMPSSMGNGKEDFIAVIKQYEEWCGVKLRGLDNEGGE